MFRVSVKAQADHAEVFRGPVTGWRGLTVGDPATIPVDVQDDRTRASHGAEMDHGTGVVLPETALEKLGEGERGLRIATSWLRARSEPAVPSAYGAVRSHSIGG